MKSKMVYLVMLLLSNGIMALAQIPVELFTGHKRATVDIMFFKLIKNNQGHNSKLLFFNRNRANIDFKMSKTNMLPQFGFTEAFSYNHPRWKGLAPVAVVSILNSGVYPKAGIQFAKVKKNYTLFSWLVLETLKEPNLDFFFLGRYTPKLTKEFHLFSQIELVNAFPSVIQNKFAFTQRLRLGLKHKEFQLGGGVDFIQIGRDDFVLNPNAGVFLRYEF